MFLFTTVNAPAATATSPAEPSAAPAGVASALETASRTTGASFSYLLETAKRESDLDPTLKSRTSSATGLFQFLDETWLATLKTDGARYGYGRYAESIGRNARGGYDIADPSLKREALALREDAVANAVMAGAFTNRNASELRTALGRQPTDGELYIAHFLGAGGAKTLLDLRATDPSRRADAVFPEAAAANRAIFYDAQGSARSVADVYAGLVARHDKAASAAPSTPLQPVQPAPPANMQAPATAAPAAPEEPLLPFAFYGLFQTERTAPANADVRGLWAPSIAAAGYAAGAGKTIGTGSTPLELGAFRRSDVAR